MASQSSGTAGPPFASPSLQPIPRDPGLPILGNLLQITPGAVGQHLLARSRHFDGIFELNFAGRRVPFISSVELATEVCDVSRFRKVIGPPLSYLRDVAGDGLFTAHSDEANWGCAHRILMPAFSQRAMKGYFDVMLRVANRLVGKWDRQGPDADIAVADDMTRLTLDTIALSGFGYDFDSFSRAQLDPFIVAMAGALGEAMDKLTRMRLQDRWLKGAEHRQFAEDIAYMRNVVDDVIRQRRAAPAASSTGADLLSLMLEARDPETNVQLDDANIRNQVITFLIAGHETTSGLLTFALYELLRNPGVLAQAYAEVDTVLPGDGPPVYADLARLQVLERVLKETLRLWPTAPAFAVAPFEDTVIGGRYRIPKDRRVSVVLTALHRDPKVWADPERFDIDRFLPENEAALPAHAYLPFGSGERACIGRQFALTEAKLALALMLRNFALSDPHDYQFRLKETLTIKPDNFVLRARRRRPHERLVVVGTTPAQAAAVAPTQVRGNGQRLSVLCASSLGTARELAEQIHAGAVASGFEATLRNLDDAVGDLPTEGIAVVVAATYNGRAPDSGRRFEAMLDADDTADDTADDAARYLAEGGARGLRLALLGCGNSQWATYQAFPRRVFDFFVAAGATPLLPRGEADGNGDFDGAADQWLAQLWQALEADSDAMTGGLGVDVAVRSMDAIRADTLPAGTHAFTVLSNTELVQDPSGLWDFAVEAPRTSTRDIRLQLPAGTTYAAGDHVAVWPQNAHDLVQALCERLDLDPMAMVTLSATHGVARGLPIGEALPVAQLLTHFVELQDVVSRQTLRALTHATQCPFTRGQLETLASDDPAEGYAARVAARRLGLLDVLTAHPAISLSLAQLLDCTVPMRPRFYSIASSPLVSPDVATLLVGTVWAPALSGRGQFRGVASTWLQGLAPGARVSASIRTPNPPFAPEADVTVPMILIGPGTGLAPFRGFLEERAAQRAAGVAVATAQLYYGCRHPAHDWLYRDDIARWASDGVAEVHVAYSVVEGAPRYVQDLLWANRAEIWRQLGTQPAQPAAGATVYVCGDGRRMAPAVRQTLLDIAMSEGGMDAKAASEWLAAMVANGRYRQDVFS
ncbi:bifunctional cytochrome P450/NADPH--P450 reductase [Cupriavidus plantarum]|uniref:Bifunctional cytochrome P450/NADPH--P450 reductase n=1 Tax=Cupriavidus plantarum TaxID=942865 RepID=A0A316EII3_9BURK|nr:cytochrome P450 [Cupriavidus plantarum]PWK31950.1 cytochrome P450/NADPH-cytochrome P450 reductase [Cupriavidus plantarum]